MIINIRKIIKYQKGNEEGLRGKFVKVLRYEGRHKEIMTEIIKNSINGGGTYWFYCFFVKNPFLTASKILRTPLILDFKQIHRFFWLIIVVKWAYIEFTYKNETVPLYDNIDRQ